MTTTVNRDIALGLSGPTSNGGSIRSAARSVQATRGQAPHCWQVFDESLMPMVTVDNERRYRTGSLAARLLFRLSLAEPLERRIDDLTPPHMMQLLESASASILRDGSVTVMTDPPRAGWEWQLLLSMPAGRFASSSPKTGSRGATRSRR
jgi:hypothetical protein